MLGDVARWLRLLGYDTDYSRNYDDNDILRIAEKDSRIIITKDTGLFRRAIKRGLKAVLIYPDDEIDEIIFRIATKTGLDPSFKPNETRCPICNTKLVLISKAEAISLVPASVGTKYDRFWKCPKCGKVYWQGNHWKTINEVLKKVQNKLLRYRHRNYSGGKHG